MGFLALLCFVGIAGVQTRHVKSSRHHQLKISGGTKFQWGYVSTGMMPLARAWHSATLVEEMGGILMFGGCHLDVVCFNDVWILSTNSLTWSLVKMDTLSESKDPKVMIRPHPRGKHTMTKSGNRLWMFGGSNNEQYMGDLFSLTVTSPILWEKVDILKQSPKPASREGHTTVEWKNRLFMFGGYGRKGYLNDLWEFDTMIGGWSEIKTISGTAPLPRSGHSASVIDDRVVIFGGSNDFKTFNNVIILDLITRAWIRPNDLGPVLPPPRTFHSAIVIPKKNDNPAALAISGGCNARRMKCYGDVWLMNLNKARWVKLTLSKSSMDFNFSVETTSSSRSEGKSDLPSESDPSELPKSRHHKGIQSLDPDYHDNFGVLQQPPKLQPTIADLDAGDGYLATLIENLNETKFQNENSTSAIVSAYSRTMGPDLNLTKEDFPNILPIGNQNYNSMLPKKPVGSRSGGLDREGAGAGLWVKQKGMFVMVLGCGLMRLCHRDLATVDLSKGISSVFPSKAKGNDSILTNNSTVSQVSNTTVNISLNRMVTPPYSFREIRPLQNMSEAIASSRYFEDKNSNNGNAEPTPFAVRILSNKIGTSATQFGATLLLVALFVAILLVCGRRKVEILEEEYNKRVDVKVRESK